MQSHLRSKGILVVVSSPSGAGKSSLTRELINTLPNIVTSISFTTRAPRANEIHGKDYYFISVAIFKAMIERNEFFEWAIVYGNYYGTPKSEVNESIANIRDMIFDIDWQGARQVKSTFPEDTLTIYILPPSMHILRERLLNRAADSSSTIEKRMAQAQTEIAHFSEYDYVIINDDFKDSVNKLKTILAAEHLKRHRQLKLENFVKNL